MWFPEFILPTRFAALVCTLLAGHVAAAGFPETAGPPPTLELALQPGEFVGWRQIVREHIRSGTNEFLFVVPDGVLPQPVNNGALLLNNRQMKFFITLRLREPMAQPADLKAELYKRVATDYPSSEGVEEIFTEAGGHEAIGLQFSERPPGSEERLVRVLWVPFDCGVLEFVLNASSADASSGQAALQGVLLTFRSNERGKLEVVRFSDKT